MSNLYLTHDELQHIEHANKVLEEHLKVIKMVVNESEDLLNTYGPIMVTYLENIRKIRTDFGKEVVHILQSTSELKTLSSQTQNIVNFTQAVVKLHEILTPELIEKLQKFTK